MSAFLEQVTRTIERYQMLCGGETVVIGLSGGADSTALLYALLSLRKQLSLTLYAAHINHMLRGAEAERDQAFVQTMCDSLHIPCHCTRQDVAAIARETGSSIEAAGHMVRYAYFREIAARVSADRIAVAHNQNDVAETTLLHLSRGCSLSGLCGIPPVNGEIIRPLMQCSRTDIIAFLARRDIAYVTDSSNQTDEYSRNRIRHKILPELERINPAAVATLAADTARFSIDNDWIQQQADILCQSCLNVGVDTAQVDVPQLSGAHPALQYRVLLRAIAAVTGSARDISQSHLDAIRALSRTGAQFQTGSLFVRRTHDTLVLSRQKPKALSYCYPLTPDKPCYIAELGITVTCTACRRMDDPTAVYLDAATLSGLPLQIRSRQDGDRFRPAGGSGEKKLKAFLIDQKIPVDIRSRIPLLTAGGAIAAVLGIRISQTFAPHADTTEFYKFTITGGNTNATYRL